eukprot:CAMPEP_0194229114 /NCGR_PEP_ID=MMETSP0156-20130528/43724_1 /TAXON_ID=33649 /ORGANISM="Thalassionema nitzschioides, Strain L26-B" /LENGTH=514 /DNA_ID=CAMNT_0038961653 /DNA_START=109 /DNA_END=1653 /DNA_ORIENTATION=-
MRGQGRRHQGGRRHNNQSKNVVDHSQDFNSPIEELGVDTDDAVTIAIEGCCHGNLDAIYNRLLQHQERTSKNIDLLVCCGDFQSLRSTADYHSLAVPPKYRTMGSFYKYYSGEVKAPILTLFVGGNHEASQALQELHYGGWVAPNIYYLGSAGVVNFAGLTIGGVSGIYKSHDYILGRFESPPYHSSSLRSVYHVRNVDIYRLKCFSNSKIDLMLSHDWPRGIYQHGDKNALLRKKPFFRAEVERDELGSPVNWELLEHLRPSWWFAAHLHVAFHAKVLHSEHKQSEKKESDEKCNLTLIPSQISNSATQATATEFRGIESPGMCQDDDLTLQMTRFLSLDKCLPRRHYLSILHLPSSESSRKLEYNLEWLAILENTHNLTISERRPVSVPDKPQPPTHEQCDSIRQKLNGILDIESLNPFVMTVAPYSPSQQQNLAPPFPIMGNPQTDWLLSKLQKPHIITVPYTGAAPKDDNEIELEDEENDDADIINTKAKTTVLDENEINLDDDDEEENE